jgi:ribosomal protein S18 acetylase RimI-like enzyme
VGYTCYGPIGCTIGSYDLYWIIVDAQRQGRGLGRLLLDQTERIVRESGGRSVYIETSNRELYLPTRRFYEKCGYKVEAILPDYYDDGDDKVILRKRV